MKRYEKAEKERKIMFFGKTERKTRTAPVILTVGALAAIGAVSITRSGKKMIKNGVDKVKGFFSKEMPKMMDDNKFC